MANNLTGKISQVLGAVVDVTFDGSTPASAGFEPVTTNVDERLSVSKTSDVELHSYEGRAITQLP